MTNLCIEVITALTGGITVFKSYESAFYSEIPLHYTGDWYVFRKSTGVLQSLYKMRNGMKHGKCVKYQQDGISIEVETHYVDNYETGDKLSYFNDCLIAFETVRNFKRDGLVIYFKYPSGEILSKSMYQNGRMVERLDV